MNTQIYLIGTAHISELSAQQVHQTIREVKPGTIFLEVDEGRAKRLLDEDEDEDEEHKQSERKAWPCVQSGLHTMRLGRSGLGCQV